MLGLVREGNDIITGNEPGIVRDAALIMAAQRVRHLEIASYGTAATYAGLLGEEKSGQTVGNYPEGRGRNRPTAHGSGQRDQSQSGLSPRHARTNQEQEWDSGSPIRRSWRFHMKAVIYNGPRDIRVVDVADPQIEQPTDVLVKITSTNICGSDLHMYEGRTDIECGRVLGHENLGEVVEIGRAVYRIKVGDKVCLPFNIGCGFCRNCEKGLTGACLTVAPGQARAAYGFADMGPFQGGQAQYLRVPFGDFSCTELPEDAAEKEDDYVMLADIFPTGWHATRLANLMPGDSVAIYGAG